jgi:hypothetical protein
LSFWHYLKHSEIDFPPTGKLRWWLLGLIVPGWAVEQYEALKKGRIRRSGVDKEDCI